MLRRKTAQALIALNLVLQCALTFMVTPMSVAHTSEDGNEVTIIICTLQGNRAITMEMPAFLGDTSESCPALTLDNIIGASALLQPPQFSATQLPEIPPVAMANRMAPNTSRFPDFTSRAPPYV